MIGTYVLSPRLLRRLLPAGAEAAPHDRRRLPGLLQAVRPDRRPGGADGGVEARRTGRRPGQGLPRRHLHAARLARRPARHERAGRPRRRRHAGRACSCWATTSPKARCCTRRMRCSWPPTSTCNDPRPDERPRRSPALCRPGCVAAWSRAIACDVLRTLPAHRVDLIVTSPPYADQRASTYGGVGGRRLRRRGSCRAPSSSRACSSPPARW